MKMRIIILQIYVNPAFAREKQKHIRRLHDRGVSAGTWMADGRPSGIAYTTGAKKEHQYTRFFHS
jgi:hypothetical protein